MLGNPVSPYRMFSLAMAIKNCSNLMSSTEKWMKNVDYKFLKIYNNKFCCTNIIYNIRFVSSNIWSKPSTWISKGWYLSVQNHN